MADNKTDDHDLEAIFRAAVNGFGLLEPTWHESYLQLQLLARHRRDLVEKRSKLQCQIRQYLERCLPGYAALFPDDDLWTRPVAMAVARRFGDAETIRQAGVSGVTRELKEEKMRFRNPRENALHLALEPARNQRGQRPETVSPFQSTGSSVRAG